MTTLTTARVILVGAGATGRQVAEGLRRAKINDFMVLEQRDDRPTWPEAISGRVRSGCKVVSSVFDDGTDTWTLRTADDASYHGQVIIAAYGPLHAPWIPDLPKRREFRGESFHSCAWDRGFDAAGKRIAVLGCDASTGRILDGLVVSAASVKVFAVPPRRIVKPAGGRRVRFKRWLHNKSAAGLPELVSSPIETLSAAGVCTRDGDEHDVEAIIYGTGFSIPDHFPDETLIGARGVTIRQAWPDGTEPYAGVAVHGFPNYFTITGADLEAEIDCIVQCVRHLQLTSSGRIEVRRSSQQVFNERMHLRPARTHSVPRAFELASTADDVETYDGPATLTIAGARRQMRVRLIGHLDPIDGQYHWQGTLFAQLPADVLKRSREVTLAIGDRSAAGRITEQTPWDTHSVAGVGAPPFALADLELASTRP